MAHIFPRSDVRNDAVMKSATVDVITKVIAVVAAVLGILWLIRDPRPGTTAAAAALGAFVVLVLWWAHRRGPHVALADARSRLAHGDAVVLWRPGCAESERLLRALRGRQDIARVNVRYDREAGRLVRELNRGHELTRTALVGEEVLRNPSAADLAAALDARRGSAGPLA